MTDDSRTGALPDDNAWPAFTIAWDDNLPGPTDVSYLLEKPAGATGFIRVVDGHLATGDGKRWRIWGQHFEHSMSLPPMDLAPIIARRLGKFGINCLRLHFLDSSWPNGILMRNTTSTRALDPEAMARFDWFVACCKREGVYLDLNLHVGRVFSDLDGVQQAATVGWGKPINYFDEWLISLQKEYARQVLEHVNPFTGNRYAEEPAIALIEITNENGLIEQWFRDLLRGENTARRTNWGDIPPAYAKKLDALWNAWLARKYPDRLALSAAWDGDLRDHEDVTRGSVRRLRRDEFDATAAARFRDEVSFYSSIERQFFREMKSFLRGELGARQLILGTSDHRPAWSGLPLAAANTTLDLTDSHSYWQHPTYANAQGPGVPPYSYVGNQAMVDDPDHCCLRALSGLGRGHRLQLRDVEWSLLARRCVVEARAGLLVRLREPSGEDGSNRAGRSDVLAGRRRGCSRNRSAVFAAGAGARKRSRAGHPRAASVLAAGTAGAAGSGAPHPDCRP